MYFYGAEGNYCNLEVNIILYAITMGESNGSCLPQTDFGFPKEICHRQTHVNNVFLLFTVTPWPCQTLHCTPQIKSNL